ncbi:hypothetical protein [Sphingorhabdus contaminans]|uniref:hypothetical protein n=1 Tax=Sphingorhabdus contaminans TaxID=1343899 RepID=UPI003D2B1BFA
MLPLGLKRAIARGDNVADQGQTLATITRTRRDRVLEFFGPNDRQIALPIIYVDMNSSGLSKSAMLNGIYRKLANSYAIASA